MRKAISKEQLRVLKSLVCERFSANLGNLSILNGFVQPHKEDGVNVLEYAKEKGGEEDKNGILAYYLVKTKSGEGLFFFSLKCGELFVPLTQTVESIVTSGEFDLFVRKIKDALETSVEFSALKDELRGIIQGKRKRMPSAVMEIYQKYGTKYDIVEKLKMEETEEKNKRILRVFTTKPGVHLVHFCKNELAGTVWKNLGLGSDRPMGEVVFWYFIAPIFKKLRALVGCEHAFLFAADVSEDNGLKKYYAQSLGFRPRNDLGTSKPWYDWTCTFMSLDITGISHLRKQYFRNFNSDRLPFDYADLNGLS